MANWSWVLALLALGVALVAVMLVGRQYDVLRVRYLRLRDTNEGLTRHAQELDGRVREAEGELRAARIQAARVPSLLDQIKDRDGEIERLRSRGGKVVAFPRGASTPSEGVTAADEWYHDVLVFPADEPPVESGDEGPPPPDSERETNSPA